MKLYFKIPFIKKIFGVYLNFKVHIKNLEKGDLIGVCNKFQNKFVVFLDYDYDEINSIVEEIKYLQEKYFLGTAHFFKTAKGYHVIIPDLLTYKEFVTVLEESNCDYHYKMISQFNDNRLWVLRTSDKPNNKVTYHCSLWNQQTRYVSKPHVKYLRIMGVPENQLKNTENYLQPKEEVNPKLLMVRYKG